MDDTSAGPDSIPLVDNEAMNEKTETIGQILCLEWNMCQDVTDDGERADCQDDWDTFRVMRESRYDLLPQDILNGVLADYQQAEEDGRNMVTEKHARMMASACPERCEDMEAFLPLLTEEKKRKVEDCMQIHRLWMAEHAKIYPNLSARGRMLCTHEDAEADVSAETYLRGELLTWSETTLELYLAYVRRCAEEGNNLVIEQDRSMVLADGFESLEAAEEWNRQD